MKHISRRYLVQYTQAEFEKIKFDQPLTELDRGADKPPIDNKYSKNHIGYLHTTNNFYIQSSPQKINNKIYLFPEPDPTLIYFSSAQNNLRLLNKRKDDLLTKIDIQSDASEDLIHDFYEYFGAVCGCVIFLFTSIESFMNSLIKENDQYINKKKNRTEIYDKFQIEQHISFDEKIKEVIPKLTSIDFYKMHPVLAVHINNLKEFRDNIIHTKTNKEDEHFKYDHIVKRSLTFKYDITIEAVAKYMNTYKQDYIIECDCGKDF